MHADCRNTLANYFIIRLKLVMTSLVAGKSIDAFHATTHSAKNGRCMIAGNAHVTEFGCQLTVIVAMITYTFV